MKKLSFITIQTWLTTTITNTPLSKNTVKIAITLIFLLSLGVRCLYWQDHYLNIPTQWQALAYDTEAERILSGDGILLPKELPDPGDGRLVLHPPGYGILMALAMKISPNYIDILVGGQILADALTILLIWLIARQLLCEGIALIAAFLVAISPHFAYYCLALSPDSLSLLPILAALYLIVLATKQFSFSKIVLAGSLIGLSCWLRANAMLLAPFLAILFLPLIVAQKRWQYALILISTTALVISPITIRNWLLFKRFIPISIGAGATLLVGIADYDEENRFGFPLYDKQVAEMDARIYQNPEYANNQWRPDGFSREQGRIDRSWAVIKDNPGWFTMVVVKRAAFMLQYNSAGSQRWPFSTANAPIVAALPPFGHPLNSVGEPLSLPPDLLAQGHKLATQAQGEFDSKAPQLKIVGDSSAYNDQWQLATMAVSSYTDYILKIPVQLQQGQMAIKLVDAGGNQVLASEVIPVQRRGQDELTSLTIYFTSSKSQQINIIVSNDGLSSVPATLLVKPPQVLKIGATPYLWTKYPRLFLRAIQKSLYKTTIMLPLVCLGLLFLALARQGRMLLIVLAVPIYYMGIQAILHTEYRYILVIHYLLFILAGVAVYSMFSLIKGAVYRGSQNG